MSTLPESPEVPSLQPRRRALTPKLRLLLLVLVLAGLFVVGKATGAIDRIDVARVRAVVERAGALGMAAFVVLFALGELVHVPGMVFVAAGIVIYGKAAGFAISLAAAIVSVSVSFALVRAAGGKMLAEVERPFVKRMLAKLDARPIATVFVLRSVLWLAPPLNYALALSSIRFRDYLAGSALGLVGPVLVATLLFDWLFGKAG